MSALARLVQTIRRRLLPPPGGSFPIRDPDVGLIAFVGELHSNERALGELLVGDGRDADDIPGFARLADRQAEIIGLIAATPAQGQAGVFAKAQAVRLRPFQIGYDGVAALGWSLAGDVIRLHGPGE